MSGAAKTYTTKVATTDEMDALAATLAPLLQAGDVFVLNGDLGAGKTRFVQGVARAMDVEGEVTSPTFNIQLVYEGPLPIYHFDLYRLDDPEQLDDVGYWESVEGDGVSFVEWGDKFPDDAPYDYVEVRFTVGTDEVRTLAATAHGARSAELMAQWAASPDAGWK